MPAPKTRYQKAVRALEKRWVQVFVTLMTGCLLVGVSGRLLAPSVTAKGETTDKKQYKFLHCDQCKMEIAYNPELDGKKCPKCQPPKPVGFLTPTAASIKMGVGGASPWRWYYVATILESFVTVGVVVYLLYLPVPDPTTTFYVFPCPHCRQRLRYRKVSLGGIGQCPRCKRPVRFPDEETAVSESVALAQEAKDLARQEDEYVEVDGEK